MRELTQPDVDADIRAYLDFPIDLPKCAVTLRHLLSHTAGFEERVDPLITQDAGKVRDLRTDLATDPPHQIFVPVPPRRTRTMATPSPATSCST